MAVLVSPELIISLCAVIISGITLVFVALPYLQSIKPSLRIEIKNRDNESIQKVLELGELYLSAENISKNTAKNLNITLKSNIHIKETGFTKTLTRTEKVPYLHPHERTKFPLMIFLDIHTELDEQFEIKKKGNGSMKVPKQNMEIDLIVKITSNRPFNRYKTYDEFHIRWDSMKSSPDWDAPRILCWNKREDKYVEKIPKKS